MPLSDLLGQSMSMKQMGKGVPEPIINDLQSPELFFRPGHSDGNVNQQVTGCGGKLFPKFPFGASRCFESITAIGRLARPQAKQQA